MVFPIAHGVLGPLDELLAGLALVIFLVMLAFPPFWTWYKKRSGTPTVNDESIAQETSIEADHYRLE